MTDTPENGCKRAGPPQLSAEDQARELKAWFVREVLPLEADIVQFLRRHRYIGCDITDLRQEVYLRTYERAQEHLPQSARPFVFAIARNVLVDRFRRERITPIVGMPDADLNEIPSDEPGPDRSIIVRDELERLYSALDRLPARSREAVVMRSVDELSRREIARRMGISEKTVKWHLQNGLRLLTALLHGEQPGQQEDS